MLARCPGYVQTAHVFAVSTAGKVVCLNPATGDDSYGLLQINMAAKLTAAWLEERIPGLAGNHAMLLDPDVNAHAAFLLWADDDANLNVAWYINRAPYRAAFESHLPAMMRTSPRPAAVTWRFSTAGGAKCLRT